MLGRSDLLGPAQRRSLTALADDWLRELLGPEQGMALVAIGGYGRGELAAGSDLDVLLLHGGRRGDLAAVADRVWYPVWDSGMSLDHSVRTPGEACQVAGSDLKAALGLLDGRHVAGDPTLTRAVLEHVRADWRAAAGPRLPALAETVAERAERFGELAYLMEPDLKEAHGGLRDVSVLRAIAAAQVADAPTPAVLEAAQVLLDVRGELRSRTARSGQRGSDRLLLQEQDALAAPLGYADADALIAAVSGAARTITYALDGALRRVEDLVARQRRKWWRGSPAVPVRRPLADGVVEQGGEVLLARDADPATDPVLLLRATAVAAEHRLRLATVTLDRLARYAAPLPQPWPAAARDALLTLLGSGPTLIDTVEALDQYGLWLRLIPEWSQVRFRAQRNAYHRYTVDRHLVQTVVEASALSRRVRRPDLLLVGALLHDIGKGGCGDGAHDHCAAGAPVAGRIAERLGYPPADVATVVALVRHHLLLPDLALHRDPEDPATLARVAAATGGDEDVLDLLACLTEADTKATGMPLWSDWKAGLLAALVRNAKAGLVEDRPHAPARLTAWQQELAAGGGPAVHVTEGSADGSLVTFVAPDRPGLLWRTAGVLAMHRLDVRSASAGTVGPTAVTTFEVVPRFGPLPARSLLRDDLRRSLDDSLPIATRLAEREQAYRRGGPPPAPPQVRLDDDASAATVIEVRTHDRAGLLYRLTRALADCGLDVRSARVSTLGADAVDAFYVTDAGGAKLTDQVVRADVVASVEAAAAG